MSHQGLLAKYESLKKIHYQALHELADAAQMIKSYDFLHNQYKQENALLKKVFACANGLCNEDDSESFDEKKADLKRAIQEYLSRTGSNLSPEYDVHISSEGNWVMRPKSISAN